MNPAFTKFLESKKTNANALAKTINVSPSTVRLWEQGAKIPHTALLDIAKYYKCSCDEVLGYVPANSPKMSYDISAEHRQLNTAYQELRKQYDARVKELQETRDALTALQKNNANLSKNVETHEEVIRLRKELMEYEITMSAVRALLKEK